MYEFRLNPPLRCGQPNGLTLWRLVLIYPLMDAALIADNPCQMVKLSP